MNGMTQSVRMFVGPKAGLRPYLGLVPTARVFALLPGASVFVLPLTEEVQEGLHRAYGTGEWLVDQAEAMQPLLTSTDARFAASASRRSAVAFIETDYEGERGVQAAATWIDGGVAQRLSILAAGSSRARALWPINSALRLLGVAVAGHADEFDAFGLSRYRTNEDVRARGIAVLV